MVVFDCSQSIEFLIHNILPLKNLLIAFIIKILSKDISIEIFHLFKFFTI